MRHFMVSATVALTLTSCSSGGSNAGGAPATDPIITPDVVYGRKFGLANTLDVYQPRRPNGAGIVFMNSGGWRSERIPSQWKTGPDGIEMRTDEEMEAAEAIMLEFGFQPFVEAGFTVFSVRHGSRPRFEMREIVADVRRAIRFVRSRAATYGVDVDRLGLWGGSAGGHLALLLGTAPEIGVAETGDEFETADAPVAAVAVYFPVTDLEQFPALDLDAAERRAFSPITFASPGDPPTLIIHGDRDALVPIDQGERMYRALADVGVTTDFMVIEGAEHGYVGDDARRARAAILDWFHTHLQGAP